MPFSKSAFAYFSINVIFCSRFSSKKILHADSYICSLSAVFAVLSASAIAPPRIVSAFLTLASSRYLRTSLNAVSLFFQGQLTLSADVTISTSLKAYAVSLDVSIALWNASYLIPEREVKHSATSVSFFALICVQKRPHQALALFGLFLSMP